MVGIVQRLRGLGGIDSQKLDDDIIAIQKVLVGAAGVTKAQSVTFTETTGAGVYTANVVVPVDASIVDIIIDGVALWAASTSATLKVGDAGNSAGFFTGVDLKATDLLAGESLSFSLAGGKAGAYIANSQVSPRYSATARTIAFVVTTVGASGATGITRGTVLYYKPSTSLLGITAATKV